MLLAGPLFSREALTSPRQFKQFLLRSGYVAALFVLMYTAAQSTFGWQQVRNVGDFARFGELIFGIVSLVQLSLVLFFALLFAAGNVAQEKDRRTLVLLLMTDLRDRELVLGKLSASLLLVAVLLAASVPVFTLVSLLGGVSLPQIGWSLAICAASGLAAGSWGSLVAFWREKTFQTLAISVLGVVLFLGVIEAAIALAGGDSPVAAVLALFNPYRAMADVLSPLSRQDGGLIPHVELGSVLALTALAVALDAAAILKLRVWNPSRYFEAPRTEEEEAAATMKRQREIWANPVLWREIRTRAYGRKIIFIKLAYLVLAAFAVLALVRSAGESGLVLGMISRQGFAFVGLALVSLMLINAQAVTALTSEKDAATLELLLVTDITAREFIFGKLGGILYNTKELILVPLLLIGYATAEGLLSMENAIYVTLGFLVLVAFAAMLGLHAGLSYNNSRTAIGNSLGTMFFLFIGIFICMMLIVQARSFALQLPSFVVFIAGGSLGLSVSLTHRNPSPALGLAALLLPFLTFYAITGFLLNETLGVWLSISAAYGFATLAMLIPAISEFDAALGRTTYDRG